MNLIVKCYQFLLPVIYISVFSIVATHVNLCLLHYFSVICITMMVFCVCCTFYILVFTSACGKACDDSSCVFLVTTCVFGGCQYMLTVNL